MDKMTEDVAQIFIFFLVILPIITGIVLAIFSLICYTFGLVLKKIKG